MRIHVHLGAHKTASTFIQGNINSNLKLLNAAGIGYLPLMPFRRRFTRRLMALPPDAMASDASLMPFFRKQKSEEIKGLIMSDENLVGTTIDMVKSGTAYVNARARTAKLAELLRPHEVTLFYSVRSYDTFIASAYCEAIRHRRTFDSFEAFQERFNFESCRWTTILPQILEGLAPKETYIWRFEDFRTHAPTIIRSLGFDAELVLDLAKSSRPSLSQTAVDVLHLIDKKQGPIVAAQLVKATDRMLPKGADSPAFNPWNADERKNLEEKYEADCKALPVKLVSF